LKRTRVWNKAVLHLAGALSGNKAWKNQEINAKVVFAELLLESTGKLGGEGGKGGVGRLS
jgi:hypothetical protein